MTMNDISVKQSYVPHVGWIAYPQNDEVNIFLSEGWFEFKEQAFLFLFLRPGDVVVDGGAHAGLYSVLAGHILQNEGKIIAVEPVPETVKLLQTNLSNNNVNNCIVLETAIHDHNGTEIFHLFPPGKAAYDSLYATPADNINSIEVNVSTLDAILAEQEIERVDFLKLDLEGAEIAALAGAHSSIEAGKLPLIMVEFTELNLNRAQYDTEALRQSIEGAGYELCSFNTDSLQLEKYIFDGPIWYDNLFAVQDLLGINARLQAASDKEIKIALDLISRGKAAECVRVKNELLEEKNGQLEKNNAALVAGLAVEKQISVERLLLLRQSYIQHQMTEERIDVELLSRWPLRLAFKYGLIRAPFWVLPSQRLQRRMNKRIAQYIAENPLTIEEVSNESNSALTEPKISVVICTYNPKAELLTWTLESIANQSLPSAHYEVILVDNNSQPKIDLSDYLTTEGISIRQVREERQGLIFARLAGIRASTTDLIIFVDDDNYLDATYLENAIAIADSEPEIGLFGGVSHGNLEKEVSKWKRKLLPYLGVRDNGDETVTSFDPHWGPWEPIGAGMVSRRVVAEAYVKFVDCNPACGGLGRQGNTLYSCEDSLFARVANQQGYACSYQPLLTLEHHIPEGRLRSRYLFRLIRDLGKSYVRLERILGREENIQPCSLWELIRRLMFQVSSGGIYGVYKWAWDFGYYKESNASQSDKL